MKKKGILYAILAALFYAVSSPFSKLLLNDIPSSALAGYLYFGAGIGTYFLLLFTRKDKKKADSLTKEDMPYIILMILLDIAAPICLLYGLKNTLAANAALLNNFEIVATGLIAFSIFKEKISKRLALAIILVTLASLILSYQDMNSLSFSGGSLLILLACVLWGIENNCTRKLSNHNPLKIVAIKGLGSGSGSLLIAILLGEVISLKMSVLLALLLGFVSYGLSISCYIYAQRTLGAAKTSTFYAFAPFLGSILSLLLLKEELSLLFLIAFVIMLCGALLASSE